MSCILVVQEAGRDRFFQETLAAGRILAGFTGLPIEAAGVGDPNANIFLELSGPPPAAGHAIMHPLLETYTADGYVIAFEQLIRKLEPAYVLFPHSYQVRDYVPRLAARFGQVLIGDVTAIEAGPYLRGSSSREDLAEAIAIKVVGHALCRSRAELFAATLPSAAKPKFSNSPPI